MTMEEPIWRDLRPAVDAAERETAPVRLAAWAGPAGWARVALHLAGLGFRDMGRNLRHEMVWFFDRISRLTVLIGLGWGLFVLAKADFHREVGAWHALAWALVLILLGAVGMGLVIALRPAPYRPW